MNKRTYLLSVFIILLAAPLSFSQARDAEKEKAIIQQLQSVAPSAVSDFKMATEALDLEDFEEAARLYELVLKKAPDFDVVYRRLGTSFVYLGRVEEGISLLEIAVEKKRSPENMNSLAQFLAYPGQDKEGSKADKERALSLALAAYREKRDGDDPSYAFLVAQLSLDLNNEKVFREVTETLVKKYTGQMATHYFAAVLAAFDEQWIRAEEEIKKAEALGFPSEAAREFLQSGVHSRATVWRYVYYSLYALAAWAVGLVLLFAIGKIMSTVTLRSLEQSDPNVMAGRKDNSLRSFYRKLISVAGFYYYISLPFVALLVIAAAASVFYAFYIAGGRIPIKLVAIIAIGAIVTIFMMIRSLFIRRQSEDPGRPLKEEEAPRLWQLAREVANVVETRPVDEIRITPGTEMAVYERGSFRERSMDKARRILILGLGTVNGFRRNAFRAVLAHEYGHFSHRDTAGGDVALRVNNDIINFAEAIGHAGQAVWWNLAFQFLRAYHFIFRRITHGATRLQEVLADRVAVRNYGADSFEEGLRHVIRRSVEFEDIAYWEINESVKARRAMENLYEMKADPKNAIEEKISEAINRPTTEDDTHPSPRDRFQLARKIASVGRSHDTGEVWELFADREALTKEMSALIEQYVKETTVG
ncbi:MAG: M48 family metalloprotease [Acidobacteriota bacterium]